MSSRKAQGELFRKNNPNVANAWLKWTDDDERVLIEGISQGKDLEALSKELKRGMSAIRSHQIKMAFELMRGKGLSAQEAAQHFGVTVQELEVKQREDELRQRDSVLRKADHKAKGSPKAGRTDNKKDTEQQSIVLLEIRDQNKQIIDLLTKLVAVTEAKH